MGLSSRKDESPPKGSLRGPLGSSTVSLLGAVDVADEELEGRVVALVVVGRSSVAGENAEWVRPVAMMMGVGDACMVGIRAEGWFRVSVGVRVYGGCKG